MNDKNKGKRDILIFPEFENISEIEKIRKQYDKLYGILPPHITLAFPFRHPMSDEELQEKLTKLCQTISPFSIEMEEITSQKDKRMNRYYLFLHAKEGKKELIQIHQRIYQEILNTKIDFEYVPHITLGTTKEENRSVYLSGKFQTVVSKLIVERIGEQEESIPLFEINLKKK